ncbi:MAG: 50S ribosomal protein L35 [Bacilli bacterium]|jgi:ribosomal protein L35
MPKMKTHKGTKKVLNVRPGGTISIGRPGSRHNTGKKSTNKSRQNRAGSLLSKADESRIKSLF